MIIYEENNIYAESSEKLMKGLDIFSDIIAITVNFNILKRGENSLKIKRTVYLSLKKTPTFLRFLPNKILKKFLYQALDLITTRVDKKLLFKLLQATQKWEPLLEVGFLEGTFNLLRGLASINL